MMSRNLVRILANQQSITKHHPCITIQTRNSFYNKYKHGPTKITNPDPDYLQWFKDFFGKEGVDFIKEEAKRIVKIPFRADPKIYDVNTTIVFEEFDTEEAIKKWKPVADSDAHVGYSTSNISMSKAGHALFHGILDNRVPDDGVTQKSGFAGIIGPTRPRDSLLAKENHWDWSRFNTLEIRYRGDGRKYMVVINTGTYTSDLAYYDVHGYPLYTRGGPYWQTYRIRFSKFIFANKGSIQDSQDCLPERNIKFVSITLQDIVDGPFALEIDYIGLRAETSPFYEESAYELYTHPHIRYTQVSPGCDPPDQ